MKKDEFTKWVKLSDVVLNNRDSIPDSPGAYQIAMRTAINRALNKDSCGIIDIGETNNLRTRIASFYRCASGKSASGHMAGWRYYKFNFSKHFPLEGIWVCWCNTKDKKQATTLEGKLFEKYLLKFGELPPLNYKYNWS